MADSKGNSSDSEPKTNDPDTKINDTNTKLPSGKNASDPQTSAKTQGSNTTDPGSTGGTRRKREVYADDLPPGCKYGILILVVLKQFGITWKNRRFSVFADGTRDARDGSDLSIKHKFFELQNQAFTDFYLKLTITQPVFDGSVWRNMSGQSSLRVFLNDPPQGGQCDIKIKRVDSRDNTYWAPTATGKALIDEFHMQCTRWMDPNSHKITKYVFKSKLSFNPRCGLSYK